MQAEMRALKQGTNSLSGTSSPLLVIIRYAYLMSIIVVPLQDYLPLTVDPYRVKAQVALIHISDLIDELRRNASAINCRALRIGHEKVML